MNLFLGILTDARWTCKSEDVAGEEVAPVPLVPPHPVDIPVAHPAALDCAAESILSA